jgi:uncharacterized protein (TIGR00661 family)
VLLSQKKQKINRNKTEYGKSPGIGTTPGQKPRILVAPLDWGLGHATRCIPVVRELLAQNCEVLLAGEGAQEKLLRLEFPELTFLPLKGYRIKYATSAGGLVWKIVSQLPSMARSIKVENKWLKKAVKDFNIHAVISDNRFGLHHSSVPCIFITHQLLIKSPFGKWTERILQKRNYRHINHFTQCWVPDLPGHKNLAGELSHPKKMPTVPVHYIGTLSRFNNLSSAKKKGHLLITLSGPEPQRTIFENIILRDIVKYEGTATVVRGLPGNISLLPSTNQLKIYNHLAADQLNEEMQQADFVISRSGYSTAMDLAALKKKSILVPTPGQTEQEFLANRFMQKEITYCAHQQHFSLPVELGKASLFPHQWPETYNGALLRQLIVSFLELIS